MIFGIPVAELSAPALVGVFVVMMFYGKVVPRSFLNDEQKTSESWRSAYEKEREARDSLQTQVKELLEIARTSRDVLVALSKASEKIRNESGGSP